MEQSISINIVAKSPYLCLNHSFGSRKPRFEQGGAPLPDLLPDMTDFFSLKVE